ncbi:hypothetical protein KEU06_09780 [Pseudaminobacter sp. 19-2017]|uniref:Uncharacterized protein n=1 Tax=Pseudaminobacter soli (ex Zhang et al. 2022) TaxID=2831468 RepID=A0A942E0S4_9HYPH|nr:hypothetical protein [Pseudaminobacter soli]MBS3648896.1 hypothetical protein [Pseudaminobacter soli]
MNINDLPDIVAAIRRKSAGDGHPDTEMVTVSEAAKLCAAKGLKKLNHRWWKTVVYQQLFPAVKFGQYSIRKDYVEALCRHLQMEAV